LVVAGAVRLPMLFLLAVADGIFGLMDDAGEGTACLALLVRTIAAVCK
jgi:hypothetical protein